MVTEGAVVEVLVVVEGTVVEVVVEVMKLGRQFRKTC